EALEEIRFYLANGMADQADFAFAKLEALKPDAATLASIRAEIQAAAATPATPVEEISIDEEPPAAEVVVEPIKPAPPPKPATPAKVDAPKVQPVPAAPKQPAVAAAAAAGSLGDLVSDLETSLGDGFGVPPAAPTSKAAPAAPPIAAAAAAP